MLTSLRVLIARVRAWWFHRADADDLHVEIDTHLALLAEEYERRGFTPDEARRHARLDFGGVTQFKEDQLERRGFPILDAFVQDVSYALRLLRREPTFTAGAVLTLAIGIGANAAVFSLLNGYLRPLPVPEPNEIVTIGGEVRGDEESLRFAFSYPTLRDLRARPLPFSEIFGYTPWIAGLRANGRVSSFLFSAVTDNYFEGLRLQPVVGRLFARGDGEHSGSAHLVVLGYTFWQRRFSGDPNVVNTAIRINGQNATVIGVVPRGFFGLYSGTEMDGYVTIDTLSAIQPEKFRELLSDRNAGHFFTVFGRLQPGTTIARAQEAIDIAAGEIERANPVTERNRSMRVYPEQLARPFPQRTVSSVVPTISMFLLALAGLVLLLAGMNVANLLFVRSMSRQREMAVRSAIGASRGRLLRQSMTESLILTFAGGAAGVLLGLLGRRLFVAGIDIGTDFPFAVNFDFDWRVFTYALAAMGVAGVVMGLWPALRASRADARTMIHDGGRHSGGLNRQRFRRLLVVAQVAGALMLLIVAGLFVRHLQHARQLDLGFDTAHVLNVRLDPHHAGYDDERSAAFYRTLEDRVRRWPEVRSASLALCVPLGYFSRGDVVYIDGRPSSTSDLPPDVSYNAVDRDYFTTMQIPVLEGRAFRDSDDVADSRAVVINQTMADRFWPAGSALGKRFRVGSIDAPLLDVIGVVRDSKYVMIFESPRPFFYVPQAVDTGSMRVLQLRTAVPPATLAARLEQEIHTLEPDLPIADLQTMQASLSGAMGFLLYRLGAYQASALGILGLLLALIGVYGVVSYSASQRTREIGIRVALGANPGIIARMILRQGTVLVVAGVVTGIVGAAGLVRVMGRFLTTTATSVSDVPTIAGVTTVLALLALWACYLPARRATRVDPMRALRQE